MEFIKSLIYKRVDELKNIKIDNESVEFLNKFSESISSLCKADFINLITCFYMVKKESNFEEALRERDKIYMFLEDMDELNSEDIIALIDNFKDIKIKYENKFVNYTCDEYLSINRLDKNLKNIKNMIKKYLSIVSKDMVNDFLKWFNDDVLMDIIGFSACIKKINEVLEETYEEELDLPEFLSSKLTRELNEQYIKEVNMKFMRVVRERFNDDIEDLRLYKAKKNNEVKQLKRNTNKKLKNFQELINKVNNNSLTVSELLKLTDDEEIIYYALLELINNKNKEYEENYKKLLAYQMNPINKLEKIFHDYNYNFNLLNDEEQKKLMSLGNEGKIQENLSFFSSSNLSFLSENDEVFVSLLLLDIENLMQIDSLLAREKITSEFVLKYGNLFDSLSIKILVRNINKLDMQKVDFLTLSKYDDKILLDLNVKLFDLIVAYDIDLKNSNLKQYEYLENPKLLNIIDKFIEIGLFNQIKLLPNLINSYSLNVIKRIILMNELGLDYLNERNTLNQMARTGKDFYLGDDLLKDYTYTNFHVYMNEEILNELNNNDNIEMLSDIPEEIEFIETFKKNNQVYMIGSNCFSRVKVLRCLKTLIEAGFKDYKVMLFNVLIYNYPNYLSIEIVNELKNIDENILRKQLTI